MMSTLISRSDGWKTPFNRPKTKPLNKKREENNRIDGELQGEHTPHCTNAPPSQPDKEWRPSIQFCLFHPLEEVAFVPAHLASPECLRYIIIFSSSPISA